jgi:hypothetical protein
VFVVQPGIIVEEEYDATQMVSEEYSDVGLLAQAETWDGATDDSADRVPEWRWFVSNDLTHLTVDTTLVSINTSSRTWHTGLAQGL